MKFLSVILEAAVSFIATNIDDIVVLSVMFAVAEKKSEKRAVCIGQYAGLAVILAATMAVAALTGLLPDGAVRWLGIVPILMGIKEIAESINGEDDDDDDEIGSFTPLACTMIAIADGGDNLGVYIPLFSGMTLADKAVTVLVYLAGVAVLLYTAKIAGNIPGFKGFVEKYKVIIIPVVFILLGISIILGL